MIEDGDAPIESFVDVDGELRVTAAAGARENLHALGPEGDGVIVSDAPLILETQDGVRREPSGPGPEDRLGLRRGLREARVVAGEEAREKGIRALTVRNPREAQLGDQAVLEGAEPILDAPLIWYENVGCTLLLIGCGQLAAVLW